MLPRPFTHQAILTHLEAVVASRTFESSARLQRFLRYVVGRTLKGEQHEIKEYSIAVEVYDRGADFDPKADALVRTEAFRLRSKLKAYYDAQGRAEALRIDLPKGSYVPCFEPNAGVTETEGSIAVLPFVSFDDAPGAEHFADGLTEEVIHALASLDGLRVVARTSVFQFKGQAADARAIGETLKVTTVLEGSVRPSGTGVRITAQLIDATSGFHVWSKTFDRTIGDAVNVQEDIAGAVADSLRVRSRLGTGAPRGQLHSPNEAAVRLYLRARYLARQWSPESLQHGLESLRQAITLDPSYAAAYAAIAEMLSAALYFGLAPSRALAAQLQPPAEMALTLDPVSPASHIALGACHAVVEHDWQGAEARYRRALEHQPGNVIAHLWYAYTVLLPLRRFDEADGHVQRALALDPLDPFVNVAYANLPFWCGDFETAFERYATTLQLAPHFPQVHWNLAYLQEFAGRPDEAIETYRRAGDLFGPMTPPRLLGDRARLLARTGHHAEALEMRLRVDAAARDAYCAPSTMAWVHLGFGDVDAAFEALDRAYEERDLFLIWLALDPRYDTIRSEPRFQRLLERMHLV